MHAGTCRNKTQADIPDYGLDMPVITAAAAAAAAAATLSEGGVYGSKC